MKYIRHKTGDTVIFPRSKSHNVMAADLGWPKALIDSAGFVVVREGRVWAGGESTSLGIASKPKEDTEHIANELGGTL